jgi:transcriptional activator protein UGA3
MAPGQPGHTGDRSVLKLAGYTRDKRGCLTCRKRKKKCDGSRNHCDQCRRLNLRCIWEAERELPQLSNEKHTSSLEPRVHPIARAPNPLQLGTPIKGEESLSVWNRRESMRYYIQVFASLLSSNVENNGFLSGEPGALSTFPS